MQSTDLTTFQRPYYRSVEVPIKPSLLSSLYPAQPCQLAIEVDGQAFCLSAFHKLCGLSGAASFDEANGARLDKYTVAVTLPINDDQIEPAVGPVVTSARYIEPSSDFCGNIPFQLIEAEAVRLDAEDADLRTRTQKQVSDGADTATELEHFFRPIFPHDGGETSQGPP